MATAMKPKTTTKKKRKNKKALLPSGDLVSLPIVPASSVHRYVRTAPIGEIVATATGTSGVLTFELNDLNNAADFTTLFDAYRFDAVEVSFEPSTGMLIAQSGGTPVVNPILITVIDYDDGTAISDEATLRDFQTCVIKPSSVMTVRRLKPKFARAVYNTPTSTAYGESTGWLDLSSSAVPHYGIKYLLTATSLSLRMRVVMKYFLSFRWVR